ncbi:unnamed protein product [Linum trigynum]|uniref:Uncharacterized protein n=1 Tax=Linum trigynum TaxID=586398 RepID=A0AAV2CCN0_9ROSI
MPNQEKPPQSMELIVVQENGHNLTPKTETPEPPSGYGPWMQVTRKSRRPNRKGSGNHAQNHGKPTVNRQDSDKNGAQLKGLPDSSLENKGKSEIRLGNKKGNSSKPKREAGDGK